MTTNFYAPPSAFRANRVVLPEGEAHHARTVLRARQGDKIVVVDGKGGWYRVRLDYLDSEQVVGTIVERRENVREPDVDITVGVGLLKKQSRFETFVEKAVELGVRRIVPLQTERVERNTLRTDRLLNVMVAAMKQCRRSRLPTLTSPHSFESLLSEEDAELRLFCHGHSETVPIHKALDESGAASALILVGPEGGFASSEVQRAKRAACTPVSLGPRRLRTETAGLIALSTVVLNLEGGGKKEEEALK